MKKIIIEIWKGHFRVKKSIGPIASICHLAELFVDGGGLRWNIVWEDWFYKSFNNVCISGNEVTVCIDDDSNIEVSSYILDEDFPLFIVSKDKFLKIIRIWQQIYQIKPQILELTQDDEDRITFEYDTPEGHQKIIVE